MITKDKVFNTHASPLIDTKKNEFRCNQCKKLLGRVFIYISAQKNIMEMMKRKNLSMSQVVKELEIKLGLETKCTRCKRINYVLEVI